MNDATLSKLEKYVQTTLGPQLKLIKRKETTDSLEVHKNGEFLGVVYIDQDENELSFQFVMTILEDDL